MGFESETEWSMKWNFTDASVGQIEMKKRVIYLSELKVVSAGSPQMARRSGINRGRMLIVAAHSPGQPSYRLMGSFPSQPPKLATSKPNRRNFLPGRYQEEHAGQR